MSIEIPSLPGSSLSELGEQPPGDAPAAFDQRVMALEPFLYAAALRLCSGNEFDARDLTQETLAIGLKCARAREFEPCLLRSYLAKTLKHRFVDLCRSRRRENARPMESRDDNVAAVAPEEEAIWEKVTAADIIGALDQLDEDLRRVIELHYLDRRKYREIARKLQIPLGTVGSKLARAREQLEKLLAKRRTEPR